MSSRFAATPLHAWPIALRRALGRTRFGMWLKARPRRSETPEPTARRRPLDSAGRNILFISHCDFTGNSAYHVHALARELARSDWSPAVAVPGSPRGALELGPAEFPILSFKDVRRGALRFPDGRATDIVHAFTPRAHVRRLTLELALPYVVHLEDNEAAIRPAVRAPHDAAAESRFLEAANGVTAVVERLLELKPPDIPGAVVWPGYDERVERVERRREEIRRDIGLNEGEVAVVYTGNVHEANVEEVRELYGAVAQLRAAGRSIVLVKSGWRSVARSRLPPLGAGLRDLGWIRRDRVYELIGAADVLVQPGTAGAFNDYRFPSKLPDYLASGNPVVLPRTNIGLHLGEGDAVLVDRGDAETLAAAIAGLCDDPGAARAIGAAGRRFAFERLRWSEAAAAVASLYVRAGIRSAA